MHEQLSTKEVDNLLKDLQAACWQLFGERLNFPHIDQHRLTIVASLEQYDFVYTAQSVGAASLLGCLELGLWVPSSINYIPSASDLGCLDTTPLHYANDDQTEYQVEELPDYTNVEHTEWSIDFNDREFHRMRKIAKCTLSEEGLVDGLYQVSEEFTLDFVAEEDSEPGAVLLAQDFEIATQVITQKDRQAIANILASVGVLI